MTNCTKAALQLTATVTLCFISAGCGTVRETLPERSAAEQLLISTAADRAVYKLPDKVFTGQKVRVDFSNLDAYDKPYVAQRLKTALRSAGARLVSDSEQADINLEMASGGLSVDRIDWLFGVPQLPLPFAVGGEPVVFPEIPLYKRLSYRGKAKFIFSAVEADTGKAICDIPICYGKAHTTYWWFFFIGPLESTDLPSADEELNVKMRYR
ncbi:MAG: DUF6655 family protein [Lentisphaeria bacterium]